MKLKIQAPEENEKLEPVYLVLLFASCMMIAITLFFLTGYIVTK